MGGIPRIVSALGAIVLVLPTLASGQTTPPPTGAPPTATPAASTSPAAPEANAAPAASAPAKPKVEATGYGYGSSKTVTKTLGARRTVHARAARPAGPVATFPGFEMLADGSSRVFVQLTQQVPVEEKKAAGSVTYVLKGAHVLKRNNENALVTVHFNTPVSRARLIPVGKDLHFIVEMRANVVPRWKLDAAKDNTAMLFVDFPKGDFLPNGQSTPPPQQDGEPATNDAPPSQ